MIIEEESDYPGGRGAHDNGRNVIFYCIMGLRSVPALEGCRRHDGHRLRHPDSDVLAACPRVATACPFGLIVLNSSIAISISACHRVLLYCAIGSFKAVLGFGNLSPASCPRQSLQPAVELPFLCGAKRRRQGWKGSARRRHCFPTRRSRIHSNRFR